jgi:AhpD family alkylhydroperoxidase
MESQLELNEERSRIRDKLLQLAPNVMKSELGQVDIVYQDGALSKKMKRLIALGIALRATCTNCILAQTQRALEAGATNEEILETIAVEISMSGTTGIAESMRVVKFLEELGKL